MSYPYTGHIVTLIYSITTPN